MRKAFQSSTPGRKGKREAETKADEWLESGRSDMNFMLAWQQFLAYQLNHNSRASYVHHESIGRNYILPNIKTTTISKIRPLHWQRCIDMAVDKGLSFSSVTNVKNTIYLFLAYADRMRWRTMPIYKRDLTLDKAPEPKEKHILQPEEIKALMTCDTVSKRGKECPAFYIYSWRFIALTGMRRGEVYGLQWDDLNESVVSIHRSINKSNEITSGKNRNARRKVILSAMAMEVLDAQREMLKDKGIRSKWIFPDEWGERSDPNRVYVHWRYYCKAHGIQSTIHEMRHTYISIMKNDMPEQMLKDLVGHSVNMDTYGVYGHVVNSEMERAKGIMDSAFARVLGSEVKE